MADSFMYGLALVVAAGACQGTFMLPTKWIKGWSWENYWLIFASTAYLICPWILALATIPRLFEVYRGSSLGSIAAIAVYGTAWGIGALTFGIAVEGLGLALGFAVILGVAATAGAVVPLLVQPPQGFSFGQGAMTAISLAVMVAGVAVCSLAGRWKEGTGTRSYRRGLLVAITSGLLSACGNLGFAFGSEITQRAEQLGVPQALAPNALWTLLTLPLFLCNGVVLAFPSTPEWFVSAVRRAGRRDQLCPGRRDGTSLDVWIRPIRRRGSQAGRSRSLAGLGDPDVDNGAGCQPLRLADW